MSLHSDIFYFILLMIQNMQLTPGKCTSHGSAINEQKERVLSGLSKLYLITETFGTNYVMPHWSIRDS